MPLPLGHSLGGFIAAEAVGARFSDDARLSALAVVALANLPDADFVPGFLRGDPVAYHHKASHSLGAAALAGALAAATGRGRDRGLLPLFALGTAVYGSHLALDMLGPNMTDEEGVQLYWPASREYVNLPWELFYEVQSDSDRSHGFLRSLCTRHNLRALAREAAVLAPLALAAGLLRRLADD